MAGAEGQEKTGGGADDEANEGTANEEGSDAWAEGKPKPKVTPGEGGAIPSGPEGKDEGAPNEVEGEANAASDSRGGPKPGAGTESETPRETEGKARAPTGPSETGAGSPGGTGEAATPAETETKAGFTCSGAERPTPEPFRAREERRSIVREKDRKDLHQM